MTRLNAKPFLKWAGGKTQLLNEIESRLPNREIKVLIEPFIGSGAVTLYLAQKIKSLEKVYINDRNPELVLVWNVIKYQVNPLISKLKVREQKFLSTSDKEERKEIFYAARKEFNESLDLLSEINFSSFLNNTTEIIEYSINRASLFIFLNRTCFNGLYRVNKKGEFNVPMGDYKNPTICDESNLLAVCSLLNSKEKEIIILEPSDYSIACNKILKNIQYKPENIFMYFDPPYRPISTSSNFTSYSKFDFTDESQMELAKFYIEMSELKLNLMLSNSDPTNTNEDDTFFDDLYKDFAELDQKTGKRKVLRVRASRNINSKGTKRGKINEILVTNYS